MVDRFSHFVLSYLEDKNKSSLTTLQEFVRAARRSCSASQAETQHRRTHTLSTSAIQIQVYGRTCYADLFLI